MAFGIGAALAGLKELGGKIVAKVGAGAAAKGVAAKGAATAAGGVAAAGAKVGAETGASKFAKFMLAKEVWDTYTTQQVLSGATQGGENARQYTKLLGGQQAAQQLPQDLPEGKKLGKRVARGGKAVWEHADPAGSRPPSQAVIPVGPDTSPQIPKVGGTPPTPPSGQGGARPQGFFNQVGERFNQWRQARAAQAANVQRLKTPVSQLTRGMDMGQRTQRLEDIGRLLSEAQVKQRLFKPSVSQEDIIGESERQEQRAREAAAEEHGGGALGTTIKGLAGLAIGGGLITLPYALHKSIQAIEQWTTAVMESHRPMERLNAAIATTFARLERQELILTARMAQATGGSVAALGERLAELREEMQPLREAGVTVRNLLQIGMARAGIWGANLLTMLAEKLGMLDWLKEIERDLRKEEEQGANAWMTEIYKKLVDGDFESGATRGPGKHIGRKDGRVR